MTITIAPLASLDLTKAASPASVTEGDTVEYAFEVTNTGTATLTSLMVAETVFTGSGTPPVPVCPGDTLAPDATMTCTAEYVATAADASAGRVDNAAIASAVAPDQSTVTSADADASFTVAARAEPPSTLPGLPATGGGGAAVMLALGALLLLIGSAVVSAARRRRGDRRRVRLVAGARS